MCKLIAILSAAISACFVSAPSFAMPIRAQVVVDTDIENARLVCDEFGRCWQTRSAPSGYRPLTKWERKGFCPPGQRKKGNC